MKCSRCQNEATTHLHQNINGQVTDVWLCPDCAEKMGVGGMFSGFGGFADFGSLGSFESLLGSFFGSSSPARAVSAPTRCSVCGSTFSDIAKRGKAGCSECYRVFESQLRPSIERIHGSGVHKGKLPGRTAPQPDAENTAAAPVQQNPPGASAAKNPSPAAELASLRAQLKAAIEREEYERAAELRDRIRAIEAQGE